MSCGTASEIIEELLAEGAELAVIEYHSLDDYSNFYGNHRIQYYYMNIFPFPMIDGVIQPVWSSYPSFLSAYEERKAIASNYSIAISVDGNGVDFEASVTMGQISANNVNKVMHVVLTESHIPESWYGGEEVNFVQRLMIPDQYGTPLLSKPVFNFDFSMNPEWVKDSCELVVFIQDTVTKEIFQANKFDMANAVISHFDVAIEEISYPGNEYCKDQLSPEIVIKNLSFENLTSCSVSYEINAEIHEYNWEGDLYPDSLALFNLPEVNFPLLDENTIVVDVSMPNGEEDENPENNMLEKVFYKAQIIENNQLILELLTDDFGSEISWELYNSAGEIIYYGEDYNNNTLYTIDLEFSLDDCYEFIIFDEGENGICCENGDGYYIIKDAENMIYIEGGDFNNEEISFFQIDQVTNINLSVEITDLVIYPNPASDHVYIQSNIKIIKVGIYNYNGQLISEESANAEILQCNISGLVSGLYFLKVETEDGIQSIRMIVE